MKVLMFALVIAGLAGSAQAQSGWKPRKGVFGAAAAERGKSYGVPAPPAYQPYKPKTYAAPGSTKPLPPLGSAETFKPYEGYKPYAGHSVYGSGPGATSVYLPPPKKPRR